LALALKLGNDELRLRETLTGEPATTGELVGHPWTNEWIHVVLDVELGVRATLSALGQRQEIRCVLCRRRR